MKNIGNKRMLKNRRIAIKLINIVSEYVSLCILKNVKNMKFLSINKTFP